jgi:hypothetical protein
MLDYVASRGDRAREVHAPSRVLACHASEVIDEGRSSSSFMSAQSHQSHRSATTGFTIVARRAGR